MPPLTEQDKEFRRSHLCASEWAAAIGESPWVSRMTLWGRKLNLLPEEPDKHVFRRGRDHEAVTLKWYFEDHPELTPVAAGPTREHHQTEAWIAGTADCLAIGQGQPCGELRGVEAKTARSSRGWGESGTDQVPRPYEIQCRIYMAVYDLSRWDIAVDLRDAEEPGYYTLERDLDKERDLIDRGQTFWFGNVVTREAPEPTGEDGEAAAIAARWPESGAGMIANTGDIEDLAEQLRLAKWLKDFKAHEIAQIENKLKLALGAAEGVEGPWGRITWQRSKDREATDWKAVAQQLEPSSALLLDHTTTKPGSRRFLFKPKEG